MTYLIEANIRGLKYWLKVKDKWHLSDGFSWEGLINNATEFTKEETETVVKRLNSNVNYYIVEKS